MNMLFAAMLCFYTQQWSVEVEKGKNSFLDRGSLAAPAPTATNDADYTKHMLFPRHKHTSDRFFQGRLDCADTNNLYLSLLDT